MSNRKKVSIWYEVILAQITVTELIKKAEKWRKLIIHNFYAYCTKYMKAALNTSIVPTVL